MPPPRGVLYAYQKKRGVAGRFCMTIKIREIAEARLRGEFEMEGAAHPLQNAKLRRIGHPGGFLDTDCATRHYKEKADPSLRSG